MKNLKQIIKRLKTSLKLKNVGKKSPKKNKEKKLKGESQISTNFLNEYNRKILKRYKRPVVKELPERKRIFLEVREVLEDIESKLRNDSLDD